VDVTSRTHSDLEQESTLMRQRLTGDSERVSAAASVRESARTRENVGGGAGNSVLARQSVSSTRKEPVRPEPSQPYHQLSGVLPSTLAGTTQDDLQDVINALGVSPAHLGLGVRPRGGSSTEAYTRTSSNIASAAPSASGQMHSRSYNAGDSSQSSGESPPQSTGGTPVGVGGGGPEVSSVERRLKALVSNALQSPVRQKRI
jgi:hypothetical protein